MKSIRKIFGPVLLGLLISGQVYAENVKPENVEGQGNKSTKAIAAGCVPATSSTVLELNNVRTLIHTGGDMWWDLMGAPKYEVPKNSGKHALFAGTIWVGGTDVNGQLRLAGLMHRTYGVDYWPGPLVTSGPERANVTSDVCVQYDRHFVISRSEVEKFRAWYNADEETRATADEYQGYTVPKIIEEWPAHGDVASGYDFYLAPFMDVDEDGVYNYNNGDYPFYDLDGEVDCGTSREYRRVRLFGDQTLWWVYNDKGNVHTETGGASIGMEIRAQAFAFSTNDELNDMTFGNYEIINRSTFTLENCYFGVWTDADMGEPDDDYVGCDVKRGLGYLYNADNEDGDGNGRTYGKNPPAVGVDFFEGPYQDSDLKDNLSSWDPQGNLDCDNGYGRVDASGEPDINGEYTAQGPIDLTEGNINGLNFGDGRVDNERWGMRRFIYFFNPSISAPPSYLSDPNNATHYYYFLRGYWRDGTRMTYGGNGYSNSGGTEADFMFPWDPYGVENTDPCGWGTGGVEQADPWAEPLNNLPKGDLRFLQSAGPFTLEPGMVNDITVGIVWARSADGYRESVTELRLADEKAQRLFENCFKVVDGPDAPELSSVALDREIILHIWNMPRSNNYQEKYVEEDFNIVCPVDIDECDMNYKFQGYQVFQLKDNTVSINEISDITKSRLVFQCDVKDQVTKLVNYEWDDELKANVPELMVDGKNEGIQHTFRVTEDQFASGDKRLVNNKRYYYIAVAYGYNNYKAYNPVDPDALDGQTTPYLAGRKSASGSITAIEVRPHKSEPLSGGTILNSEYGDGVYVTRIEGLGTGQNAVELRQESIDTIMSGSPWKDATPDYMPGSSPVNIKIVDPLNVKEEDFILRFDSVNSYVNGFIKEANWFIYPASEDRMEVTAQIPSVYDGVTTTYKDTTVKVPAVISTFELDNDGEIVVPVNYVDQSVYPPSAIHSDASILVHNEQLILDYGISIDIAQVDIPMQKPYLFEIINQDKVNNYIENNGLIGYNMVFEDDQNQWLTGVPDLEDCSSMDWIKAGTGENEDNPQCDDYTINGVHADDMEVYEGILGGTWAPYLLCATDAYDENPFSNGVAYYQGRSSIQLSTYRFSSVDVVITSDRSKWTRCPVIETCENDTTDDPDDHVFMEGITGVYKFDLKNSPSIDKDGNFADTTQPASTDENSANYISAKGMGWFPGYAIDLESGERLNMVYGEDSWMGNDYGRDMLWNPSSNYYSNLGNVIFGGKHYLYVFGHNYEATSQYYMPAYDAGAYMVDMMTDRLDDMADSPAMEDVGCAYLPYNLRKAYIWRNAMWATIPMVTGAGKEFTSYDDIPCDVTVSLRVATSYWRGTKDYAIADSLARNDNYPMFTFSTKGLGAVTEDGKTAENALDLIKVVPNPYYGHNAYEESQLDYKVKITNLPEKCTISIYSLSGTLIKKINKDSDLTYQDWNLKNEYGILIASGLYIVHIDAPGIGEKVVKWFGSLRPMDMNNF